MNNNKKKSLTREELAAEVTETIMLHMPACEESTRVTLNTEIINMLAEHAPYVRPGNEVDDKDEAWIVGGIRNLEGWVPDRNLAVRNRLTGVLAAIPKDIDCTDYDRIVEYATKIVLDITWSALDPEQVRDETFLAHLKDARANIRRSQCLDPDEYNGSSLESMALSAGEHYCRCMYSLQNIDENTHKSSGVLRRKRWNRYGVCVYVKQAAVNVSRWLNVVLYLRKKGKLDLVPIGV